MTLADLLAGYSDLATSMIYFWGSYTDFLALLALVIGLTWPVLLLMLTMGLAITVSDRHDMERIRREGDARLAQDKEQVGIPTETSKATTTKA